MLGNHINITYITIILSYSKLENLKKNLRRGEAGIFPRQIPSSKASSIADLQDSNNKTSLANNPPFTLDNCQMDICPCNICPGNICSYQQYLSCYWPNFDQISKSALWDHPYQQMSTVTVTFVRATFDLATVCPYQLLLNQFWQNFKGKFLEPSWADAIWPNFLTLNYISAKVFQTKFLLDQKFFWTKFFWTKIYFGPNFFGPKFFGQNFLA